MLITLYSGIKYPITNQETGEVPIYDNEHEIHNSKLLFRIIVYYNINNIIPGKIIIK